MTRDCATFVYCLFLTDFPFTARFGDQHLMHIRCFFFQVKLYFNVNYQDAAWFQIGSSDLKAHASSFAMQTALG